MSDFGKSGAWLGWRELSGDISWEDYGGNWGFQDPGSADRCYVIKFDNMLEHMSEREMLESGIDKCVAQVVLVDLAEIPDSEIASALECYDFESFGDTLTGEDRKWAIVECCAGYGLGAPMGEFSSNWAVRARSQARGAVEDMIADSDVVDALLDRPVNALGSTAREYGKGDITSAIERGVVSGDASARLTAKLYGVGEAEINDARPADWLPYAMGYTSGLHGAEKESGEDIVPEYFQGYERGVRVAAGEVPAPSWIK